MSDSNPWTLNPDRFDLGENEIHIWRAYLDCGDSVLRKFETTLAPDEKSRANHFIFLPGRRSFIAARGILRELLGQYLNRPPDEVEFSYHPQGKPFLRDPSHQSFHFNISHSHGMALFSFAWGRELGVDVELVKPDFAGDEIAKRYFSPDEFIELQALPPSLRAQGFFRCWTLKEAYIKARGGGLNIPLDSFHVSFTPGQPQLLRSDDSARWNLCSLAPDPLYAGALVAEGEAWQARYWEWKP
jgi:4'-phosphopantetheinyl transferase